MSLRKRKKQKDKSVLPVLINPGPAPVAVNPWKGMQYQGNYFDEASEISKKDFETVKNKFAK